MLANSPGDSDVGYDGAETESENNRPAECKVVGGPSEAGKEDRKPEKRHDQDRDASEEEGPLQTKTTARNASARAGLKMAPTTKGRVLHPTAPKRTSAPDKGHSKVDTANKDALAPPTAVTVHPRPPSRVALRDKENGVKSEVMAAAAAKTSSAKHHSTTVVAAAKPATSRAVPRAPLNSNAKMAPGNVKGGARRVPLDSAEAPTIVRGRRAVV